MGAQDVYNALISAGLSRVQATGVLGNIQSESSFNPEAKGLDSNGKYSYGLVQWNAGSYPGAGSLVTGNPGRDLTAQVNYLLHNTSNIGKGLAGTTAAEVAGNFARYVEICQGCQPGGSSFNQRVAQANSIYQQAVSGNWTAGGSGVDLGSGGGSTDPNAVDVSTLHLGPLDIPLPNLGGVIHIPTPNDIARGLLNGIAGWFGGTDKIKDLLERSGLIVLGAIVILVGLKMFSDQSNTRREVLQLFGVSPKPSGGSHSESTSTVEGEGTASRADSDIVDAEVVEPTAIGGRAAIAAA